MITLCVDKGSGQTVYVGVRKSHRAPCHWHLGCIHQTDSGSVYRVASIEPLCYDDQEVKP